MPSKGATESAILAATDLDALFDALRAEGYRIVGPTVRDGAIVHAELPAASALPAGWTDEQEPASYRLERREDEALFGYAVGPHSFKQELLPPRVRLWQARRENGGLAVEEEPPAAVPTAFVGVRPCELAAIAIQDRVFLGGSYVDRDYAARRADVFIVAVDCGDPSSLCFCTSVGGGPGATEGFDLALTELLDGGHRFLVRSGSPAGGALLAQLPVHARDRRGRRGRRGDSRARSARHDGPLRHRPTSTTCCSATSRARAGTRWPSAVSPAATAPSSARPASARTSRTRARSTARPPSARASGTRASRVQYAEMHGGNTRPTPRARYRQWLTHKLATWEDQFGSHRLRRLRPLHRLVPRRHRHPGGGAGDPRRGGRACARLTH